MAPASVSGRNRRRSRSGWLTRSRTSSSRTKDAKGADDAAAVAAERPDIDELRQKRATYYTKSASERQKVPLTRGEKSSTRAKTSTASVAEPVPGGEHRRRRKQRDTDSRGKTHRIDRRKTDDYVYTDARVRDVPGRSVDAARRLKHRSSASTRRLSAPRDEEVTPEDSISQVGANSAPPDSRPSHSRSLLQRTATTSVKLAPIIENTIESAGPSKPSRRTSTRDASLFAALLRRTSTSTAPQPPRFVECLTCGSDDVPSTHTAKLSCGHRMCHECLKRVFEMSVKDAAHMPPRCCAKEHIPLKHVDKLFDLKFKVLWNRKYQEYHTKNRIYCPTPKCGEWIKPSHIHTHKGRKYAQCPRCTTKVCTQCNAKMHKSTDCPKDLEIAKLVAQAKEKGWQSCYNCHAMVELKEGCNHMTCRCLAQFCMICGSKWKSCDCPWFNYRDLPDPDRLNDMRVPEEIRVVYRRVMGAAGMILPEQPPPPPTPQLHAHRQPTYSQELDQRRRQERLDADLARRMQLGLLLDPEDEEPRDRHREANVAAWGLDNGTGGHFMNDNFVSNAANVVMSAFGDATMGRRGDRESGRRRRARHSAQNDPAGDGGLVPNFLGDESVLGVGPSRRS